MLLVFEIDDLSISDGDFTGILSLLISPLESFDVLGLWKELCLYIFFVVVVSIIGCNNV
jgi:hypothetical protein